MLSTQKSKGLKSSSVERNIFVMKKIRTEVDPMLQYALDTSKNSESESSDSGIEFVGNEESLQGSTVLADSTINPVYDLTTEDTVENEREEGLKKSKKMENQYTKPKEERSFQEPAPVTDMIKGREWLLYAEPHEEKEITDLSYAICEAMDRSIHEVYKMIEKRKELISAVMEKAHLKKVNRTKTEYNSRDLANGQYAKNSMNIFNEDPALNEQSQCIVRDWGQIESGATQTEHPPLQIRYTDVNNWTEKEDVHHILRMKESSPSEKQGVSTIPMEDLQRTGIGRNVERLQQEPSIFTYSSQTAEGDLNTAPKTLTFEQMQAYVCLRKVFLLYNFRQNQLAIITSVLSGNDVFVLMPTGGGKSLTFQLPAVISDGVTVVISPLLALIQDQIKNLLVRGIPAVAINSSLTKTERAVAYEMLCTRGIEKDKILPEKERNQVTKIVYATPELLVESRTFNSVLEHLLQKNRLTRFIVDEAHCVSQWGHDFRPDYTQLFLLRERYPSVPITALTATATEAVKKDVADALRLRNYKMYTQSFNRPNLKYQVIPKGKNPIPDIVSFIETYYPVDSGIIYCLSKRDCEWLAEVLHKKHNIRAGYYHAGLSTRERTERAREWDSSHIRVIVATIAFGMGIDKKDVRYVIHYSLPKSLEGYYQETGRAGRDQLDSVCVLYYTYGDKRKIDYMIDKNVSATAEAKTRQRRHLQEVISYCENKAECRRYLLLHYFGENFKKFCRDGCDNCQRGGTVQKIDCLDEALQIIKVVKKAKLITEGQLITEMRSFSKKTKDILSRTIRWLVGQGHLETKLVMGARGFSWSYIKPGRGSPVEAYISMHSDEGRSRVRTKLAKASVTVSKYANSIEGMDNLDI